MREMQKSQASDSQTSPEGAVIEFRVRDLSDLLEARPGENFSGFSRAAVL